MKWLKFKKKVFKSKSYLIYNKNLQYFIYNILFKKIEFVKIFIYYHLICIKKWISFILKIIKLMCTIKKHKWKDFAIMNWKWFK